MKNLKNLGKALNKQEQQKIHGGGADPFIDDEGGSGGGSGGGGSTGGYCTEDSQCPNYVDRFSGNYCQGFCQFFALGNKCSTQSC